MRRTLHALTAAIALGALLVGCGDDESAEPPPTTAPESGFALDADQLEVPRSTIVGHPGLGRWEVEVAHVKENVASVTLYQEIPPDPPDPTATTEAPEADATTTTEGAADEADGEDTSADVKEADAEETVLGEIPDDQPDLRAQYESKKDLPLTPIPSPSLNWGSAQVDDTWLFQNPTKSGNPLVFLVVENRGEWLKVQFPARPNHQTAWLNAQSVELQVHKWHAEVNATTNQLRVWNGDELVADTLIIGGTDQTPIPLGRFYYNEKQYRDPSSAYGSWILSTNGFSDALELFGGDVPIWALHGTNIPDSVGQDLSNGCVRMPNPVVEMLAAEMPLGTPIDVVA